MPGTLAAVAVVGCCASLTLGFAAAGSAAVFGQRLAGAADAAALAAADAASGAVVGVPCELAEHVSAVFGAALTACEVDGLTATVSVSARFGPVTAAASARAGQAS
jgi:secretion/DNA translocation related TadE-like protein